MRHLIKFAYATFISRAFMIQGEKEPPHMIPLVDLANYHPQLNSRQQPFQGTKASGESENVTTLFFRGSSLATRSTSE